MNLQQLLQSLSGHSFSTSIAESTENIQSQQKPVTQICADSRKVDAGSVFVAVRGSQSDSHQFLKDVVERQPVAIVYEKGWIPPSELQKKFQGVWIETRGTREALDRLASQFYGNPSQKLFVFGVTGTNGKTSCVHVMEHILNAVKLSCGVIGTINHHIGDHVWESSNTTPGPLELQSRMADMLQLGAKAVALEVTSHALDQHRADSVDFNTVLFTNLSRDHMDYHKDMNSYFAAKQKLFTDLLWRTQKPMPWAIVNTDDEYGRRLRIVNRAGLWTYGQNRSCDFRFKITSADFSSTQIHLVTPFGELTSVLPVSGVHSIYNIVGVVAAASSLGIPVRDAMKALQNFPGVPGRLQRVLSVREVNVFIDYAHTPDALKNVLTTLVNLRKENRLPGRLITVFGCGGDRDKGKRPEMGALAEDYSDVVVVTSDNPRTEDAMSIIADILSGFKKMKPFIEVDRRAAINFALQQARPGDAVLIAGKGHEEYQIIGQERREFSDYKVVQEILR